MDARILRALALARSFAPTAVQLAGVAAFVVAAFTLAPWLGWAVLGLALVFVGTRLDDDSTAETLGAATVAALRRRLATAGGEE